MISSRLVRGCAPAHNGGGDEARRNRERTARFERARRAAAAGRDVRMSLQIVEDKQVARAVCDYAVEHAFDLLVLGRHGDGTASLR